MGQCPEPARGEPVEPAEKLRPFQGAGWDPKEGARVAGLRLKSLPRAGEEPGIRRLEWAELAQLVRAAVS